ncbi:NAD(P)/FAD-dependent oxidoreductase [Kaistia dalseonensis]|nr:NAD(P)/FAD-dependent oxidoreductase [Kaistia dalseonensis]MCX5495693.1 NAD(P)/FAD-dependent oxidoreductase [Kaistia dalseonensis]
MVEGDNHNGKRLRIAVIGSGISGLSCAWLLGQRHDVTLYERNDRLGGHSNTVTARTDEGAVPVDTGFIVYNESAYPNLTALFATLGVATKASDMSFAVSLRGGTTEYSGTGLAGLFAQWRNLLRPRFWSMLSDLMRFYREAPSAITQADDPSLTLGSYLERNGYGAALRDDHLLPMAAAIWSSPTRDLLDYPAASFIRFCANHGLLQVRDRPVWRTVEGGSRSYVERFAALMGGTARIGNGVAEVLRLPDRVLVQDRAGAIEQFDHVVIATHADQALAMLVEPDPEERRLLGAFRYSRNHAVLHSDETLMPKRRSVWSSWNYIETEGALCVSYWMNRLQGLQGRNLFVTLNPPRAPRAGTLLYSELYEHPVLDTAAVEAQRSLWSLQGVRRTWFCGAHFGAGFHEDGLQSGLAVAEQLGGVTRPWRVANESGRIHVQPLDADRVEATQ